MEGSGGVIEQGFVMYVQAQLAALSPPVNVPGGFQVQLPKDLVSAAVPQAWSYRWITDDADLTLGGQGTYTVADVQIDCHGYAPADETKLAAAIKKALRPASAGVGKLSDPDQTLLESIVRLPSQVDGYSDANRTYVRSLEYRITYYAQ